jgi:hypothetical protein
LSGYFDNDISLIGDQIQTLQEQISMARDEADRSQQIQIIVSLLGEVRRRDRNAILKHLNCKSFSQADFRRSLASGSSQRLEPD